MVQRWHPKSPPWLIRSYKASLPPRPLLFLPSLLPLLWPYWPPGCSSYLLTWILAWVRLHESSLYFIFFPDLSIPDILSYVYLYLLPNTPQPACKLWLHGWLTLHKFLSSFSLSLRHLNGAPNTPCPDFSWSASNKVWIWPMNFAICEVLCPWETSAIFLLPVVLAFTYLSKWQGWDYFLIQTHFYFLELRGHSTVPRNGCHVPENPTLSRLN